MFNVKRKHVPLVISVILTQPCSSSLTGLCLGYESSDDLSLQPCSAWSSSDKRLQLPVLTKGTAICMATHYVITLCDIFVNQTVSVSWGYNSSSFKEDISKCSPAEPETVEFNGSSSALRLLGCWQQKLQSVDCWLDDASCSQKYLLYPEAVIFYCTSSFNIPMVSWSPASTALY